jgi:uncharacterized membrane protein YcgQ (UPF0703/DUF1980 family)
MARIILRSQLAENIGSFWQLKWPFSTKLKTGAWVKVHGKVTFTTYKGADYPAISAVSVEKTRRPKNQFLIPK